MTAVSQPAARRGSTVFLPAPERPLPPDASWSGLLAARALSSFSNSDRSIETESSPFSKRTVAADGDADPQAAPASASPAQSAAAEMRRNDITASHASPGLRRPGR